MTKDEIALVLEWAGTWPEEAQRKLIRAAIAIEREHEGVYTLTEAERADLSEAEAEFDRGEVASDSDVANVFDQLRNT